MGTTNKVKFGLKNCYYAVATLASNNSASYSTPVALPGAVSLSLDAQGDNNPFYADDIVYYADIANGGYSGSLELALIPDAFKKDVLGYKEDSNDVLYEDADAQPVNFALLFEFAGDKHATRHVMYNCTASRPKVGSQTKAATSEPQTETIDITATSVYNASVSKNVVKARVTPTEATQYAAWFSSVYQPAAASATTE